MKGWKSECLCKFFSGYSGAFKNIQMFEAFFAVQQQLMMWKMWKVCVQQKNRHIHS